MLQDHSAGVIPIHDGPEGRRFLVVRHKAGHWGFPKGHPEQGESDLDAARRELREETGIRDCRIGQKPRFEERYHFTKRKSGRRVLKSVVYFLGFVADPSVEVQPDEVQDYAWGDLGQTLERLSFDEGRALLREVADYLEDNDE